jgi:beta-galactosidase
VATRKRFAAWVPTCVALLTFASLVLFGRHSQAKAPRLASDVVSAKTVQLRQVDGAFRLEVNGQPYFVVGARNKLLEDPANKLWQRDDAAVKAKLAAILRPLELQGVNTLVVSAGIDAKWTDHMYTRYGMRAALLIRWHDDEGLRRKQVQKHKAAAATLAWLLDLDGSGRKAAKEAPAGNKKAAVDAAKAVVKSPVVQLKAIDPEHAVALWTTRLARLDEVGRSDVDFLVVDQQQKDLRAAYAVLGNRYKKPLVFAALTGGANASHPALRTGILLRQWQRIYAEAVADSKPRSAIGAFAFSAPKNASAALAVAHRFNVFGRSAATRSVQAHFATIALPAVPKKAVSKAKKSLRKKATRSAKAKDQPQRVTVHQDAKGFSLQVAGRALLIKGMNWGYMPIGENYSYAFWNKSDDFVRKALDQEMALLKAMGVNAIRQYDVIPPRWVTYIYRKYGIYTMVNHLFGRYGFSVDGVWQSPINYQSKKTRAALKRSVMASIKRYRNTPGVLLWLLGNENNYGLHWASSEIEDLPVGKRNEAKATFLYSLFGEVVDMIHKADALHPVAICNGDVQYVDLIAKHAPNIDIFGTNVYRGKSVRDMFKVVKAKLNVPVMFTEFGSDSYNAREDREDHLAQASYLKSQWREIYEESYGQGGVANSIGGFVFQWSDGWWKYKQEENLDVHDTNASWATGAYKFDFMPGANNMNEEWFGICAKGQTDENGHYPVYPRAAYYVLRDIFALDPLESGVDRAAIAKHFKPISPYKYDQSYQSALATEQVRLLERIRIKNLAMKIETFTTGGRGLRNPTEGQNLRFNHLESFFLDFEVQPIRRFTASVAVNIIGNVPDNPINDIFYEARGRRASATAGADGSQSELERLAVYNSKFNWDEPWFNLSGYYRVGHYHWMDKGDFFNLYRSAHYGHWIDTYNANTPFGMAFTGKKALEGLRIAAGPQLYWGANPTAMALYSRSFGDFRISAMHQEDIAGVANVTTSARVPEPQSRKTTVAVRWKKHNYTVEAGGIIAGTRRIGRPFSSVKSATGISYLNSGQHVVEDEIRPVDTLGAKVKVVADWSAVKAYVQGTYKGLVADGGPDEMPNFTGWSVRESGRGNQFNVLGGVLWQVADFQIAPNVLYQRPLESALPVIGDFMSANSGIYYPGTAPRNIRDDPFVVLENRETIAFEMLLAYDPTPGTYMWMWDNQKREDAPFAANLDFVYRIQPTARDSGIGFSAQGNPQVLGAVGAANVWELKSRVILNLPDQWRILANIYGGQGQANSGGSALLDRMVTRVGGDFRVVRSRLSVAGAVNVNDWGPYDYHRDYNITFPLQLYGDVSYALKWSEWMKDLYSRIGASYRMRFLDEYSVPLVLDAGQNNYLWEMRTYLNVTL